MLQVQQDGGQFYDAETGEVIWCCDFRVLDSDIDAAKRARAQFLAWFHDAYQEECEFVI